jgi:hypothetical protein
MKVPELDQLVRAARALPDDERVPYAFEKRIMARVRSARVTDVWSACAATMWRAAFSCLAIMLLTGAVVRYVGAPSPELFAGDLERTVLAPVDIDESW